MFIGIVQQDRKESSVTLRNEVQNTTSDHRNEGQMSNLKKSLNQVDEDVMENVTKRKNSNMSLN